MEITVGNILSTVVFLAGTVGVWVIRIKAKAAKAEDEKLIDDKIKADKVETERVLNEKIRAVKAENEKLIDDKIRAAVKPLDKAILEISQSSRDQQ